MSCSRKFLYIFKIVPTLLSPCQVSGESKYWLKVSRRDNTPYLCHLLYGLAHKNLFNSANLILKKFKYTKFGTKPEDCQLWFGSDQSRLKLGAGIKSLPDHPSDHPWSHARPVRDRSY